MRRPVFRYLISMIALQGTAAVAQKTIARSAQEPLFFERVETSPLTYTAQSREFMIELKPGVITIERRGGPPDRVQMRLTNRVPLPAPQTLDALPGRVHHLIGPATSWRRNNPRYARVRYANVYPGIDLVFHGDGKRLEYDFVVAAGADPSVIGVEWIGARKLRLSAGGDLIIETRHGEIRWDAPVLYQFKAGERTHVDGHFALLGRHGVSFRVGDFDRDQELVIDPSLSFSTYLGGALFDIGRGIAADAAGNVYVVGWTRSVDLKVTPGVAQTAYAGNSFNVASGDGFVAKYNSVGALVYLTYLGGARDDIATAIAVDASGNAYVTGYTNSTDFPVTANALQKTYAGSGGNTYSQLGDVFVTKLSGDGSRLLYSTYLGGAADDIAFGIAVDSSGSAYVTGTTLSSAFPTTAGAFQRNYRGSGNQEIYPLFGAAALIGGDVFVSKLDPGGSKLIYSTLLGGIYDDCALSIAVDAQGNASIGGYTLSPDFPTTSGALQRTFHGREVQNEFFNYGDAFVARLDANGANLVFSTYVGGQGDEQVWAVAVDSIGNTYATGSTSSTDFPVTAGVIQPKYAGPLSLPLLVDQLFGDVFVVKLTPTGGLAMGTYLGGSGDEIGYGIAVDGNGNILVAGNSNSANFPVTQDAVQPTLAGPGYAQDGNKQGDGFLVALNPSGSAETYGTFFGGTTDDVFLGMALSSSGTAYMTGATGSTNFPLSHAVQSSRGGPTTTGVSRSDAVVTAISGFAPRSSTAGITAVLSVSGEAPTIAPNTWVEIKGAGIVPASTPADGVIWSTAREFAQGRMPTQIGGAGATVNGKSAFMYFFCSAVTNKLCTQDQINILTPLDTATGPVQVQVTSPSGTFASTVNMQAIAPGFFQNPGTPYVLAVHLNGARVGPLSLYPGLSSPAAPNEAIVLYANGFGDIVTPLTNGSSTQFGSLPTMPEIRIGNFLVTPQFAGLVSPGLFQFNIIVPSTIPDGDIPVTATYKSLTTQSGILLTVQH